MKILSYSLLIFCLLLTSCEKKTGASEKAMSFLNDRFLICHLKDSIGDAELSNIWSEYDSEHNSVICFRYGPCAIEYYFHINDEGYKRDTFIIKTDAPIVDDLRDSYKKMTDKDYLSNRLSEKQLKLFRGFSEHIKKDFPSDDDFIEYFINVQASNDF